MLGFPPPPDSQVTLANWQDAPNQRWAFQHVREIVPTQTIRRGPGPVSVLPTTLTPVGFELVRRYRALERQTGLAVARRLKPLLCTLSRP